MLQIVRYRTFPNICPHRIFSLQTPRGIGGAIAPPREGQGVLLGQNLPPLYPPLGGKALMAWPVVDEFFFCGFQKVI